MATKNPTISGITDPRFTDPDKARKYLESVRWPEGPFCPHCGEAEDVRALKGKSHRPGLYQCNSCRNQFTVTVGTLFERSKVPLNKWLLAAYLLCSSKKGISTHQLHRSLGVTYKTAWFMTHRIREAMREGDLPRLGGPGGSGTVEMDETYYGHTRTKGVQRSRQRKERIISLVERGGGVRSYHVPLVNRHTVAKIVREQLHPAAKFMTDEAPYYPTARRGRIYHHESVNHSAREYVRGEVHTNTIEGFFSILKRGLTGVYQHVSPAHLKRYLAEFDFRYTYREMKDGERTAKALEGISGKRLTYRRTTARA